MTETDYFQKLNKKNKTSAVFFLAGAAAVFVITALFLLFFIFVFGALQAAFSGVLGSRAGDGSDAFWNMIQALWVFGVLALAAIAPQVVAGIAMLKKVRWARGTGIAAFFVTLITFTPVALLLIYPLVFLLGDDGKYFYKTLRLK